MAIAFIACEKEYVAPSDFSDVGWYSSLFRDDTVTWNVGVDHYLSFSDASVNELEHEWVIPDGAFFLKGPISRSDTNYVEKIIHKGENSTTDKTVHILFTKGGGKQTIMLRDVFKDSVAFRGLDTIPAIRQGDGTWLYEQKFNIDVYDTIQAKAIIMQNGAEVPLGSDTIYVENGNSLEFVDVTTVGRPNTRQFRVGSAVGTDSVSSLVLKNLGVFEATFSASRSGENIPGDYDQFVFPNPIKVTPSSLPFELASGITEMEDQTLQLPFSGGFTDNFVGQESFFTVKVNGTPFTVESLGLNASDGSILELKLKETIYSNDTITVSLADGSGIRAADTRKPVPFTDEPVAMFQHDLVPLDLYGFEAGDAFIKPTWDNIGTIEISTEQAASGTHSLKLTAPDGNWTAFNGNGIPEALFTLKAGVQYQFSFKIFMDPASTMTYVAPWFIPAWKQMWTAAPATTGQWVEIEEPPYTPGSDQADSYIYFRVNQAGIVYLDDLKVRVYDVRP